MSSSKSQAIKIWSPTTGQCLLTLKTRVAARRLQEMNVESS